MKPQVTLRPWEVTDAAFCCYTRNDPRLYRWFRQDEPIKLKDQKKFIAEDKLYDNYGGMVIEVNNKPVGLCAVKMDSEFSIAVLPEHQGKGIAKRAMQLLIKKHPYLWSEVFVGNPALGFYLFKFGFKITGVKERAYYKKGVGLVDVVKIEHGPKYIK